MRKPIRKLNKLRIKKKQSAQAARFEWNAIISLAQHPQKQKFNTPARIDNFSLAELYKEYKYGYYSLFNKEIE
ncbi:MAG: hypothetical protein AAF696_23705 [Bacteroidota bacterium]